MARVFATVIGLVAAIAFSGPGTAIGDSGALASTTDPPPVTETTEPNAVEGLLRPAEPASDDPHERIDQLTELMRAYLDREEYTYTYLEDEDKFYLNLGIGGAIGSCDANFFIYDDMISFNCWPALRVPKATRENTAEFITRVNFDFPFAILRMSFEDGSIATRTYILVEEALPTLAEIDAMFHAALVMFDDYGDGLVDVVINGEDPERVFTQIAGPVGNE